MLDLDNLNSLNPGWAGERLPNPDLDYLDHLERLDYLNNLNPGWA